MDLHLDVGENYILSADVGLVQNGHDDDHLLNKMLIVLAII
jgi:hypothetical protein